MASLLQKGESALREIISPHKSKDNLKPGATSPGTRSPPPEEAGARKSSEIATGASSPTNSTKRGFFGFGKKKEKERDSRSVSSAAGTISPPESPPQRSLATSPNLKPVTTVTSDAQVPATSISNEPPAAAAKGVLITSPPLITTTTSSIKPISPPLSHPSSPTSPIRSISPPSPPLHSRVMPPISSSPPHLTSSRISSSGSSQIFERNVQEGHPISTSSTSPTINAGSKIPAHIATEDHIPAVLEASSIAITDKRLNPDNVEVVMHAQHQPLAAQNALHHPSPTTQREATDLHDLGQSSAPSQQSLNPSAAASNFTADKRRLSFISFSDIVQAEQADLLDSTLLSPATNTSSTAATTVMDQVGISGITETLVRRSPSPIRGRNVGYGTSPPRSSGGFLPERDNEGLVVETMGQALRKTGSGDLGKGGLGGL